MPQSSVIPPAPDQRATLARVPLFQQLGLHHLVTVGVGSIALSVDPCQVLVTHSLGSCLGVTAHDPVAGVGALGHFVLPFRDTRPHSEDEPPAKFTDVGLVTFFDALHDHGARSERLVVKVAGGAARLQNDGLFQIGRRNYAVLCRFMAKNHLRIMGEAVGSDIPRTMRLYMADGRTTTETKGIETIL